MAIEIAEAVIGALRGELAATAVNAPMVPAEVSRNFSYNFAFCHPLQSTFYFLSSDFALGS